MIALSSIETSANVVILDEDNPDVRSSTARMSRVATLDGGSSMQHKGICEGDRTIEVSANVTEAEAVILDNLFKDYVLIYLSQADGAYSGAIYNLLIEAGKASITFWVSKKVSG